MKLAALARRLALLLCLGVAAPGAALAEEFFNVILLGTGSPRPAPNRNGPSTLIEAGGLRLLFDMGRGHTVSLCSRPASRWAASTPTSSPTCTRTTSTAFAEDSHIVTPSNPPADAAEILRQTRSTYAGAVVVGEDMMRFRVTDAGVEQVMAK